MLKSQEEARPEGVDRSQQLKQLILQKSKIKINKKEAWQELLEREREVEEGLAVHSLSFSHCLKKEIEVLMSSLHHFPACGGSRSVSFDCV